MALLLFISVTSTVADYLSLPIFLKSNIVIAKCGRKKVKRKREVFISVADKK